MHVVSKSAYSKHRDDWLRVMGEGARMKERDESADTWVFVMALSAAAHHQDVEIYDACFKKLVGGSWVSDTKWIERVPISDCSAWAASLVAIAGQYVGMLAHTFPFPN
jgi:hypothetical protein